MEQREPKHRWLWLVLLLLLFGTAYSGYRKFRTDPNIRKIRDLRKELASGSNLTSEQRQDKFRQIRETMEKLPPERRDQMRKEMAEEGRRRFEAELRRYASLSPQEKTRYLDQQIDRMEAARRQWQQAQGGSAPRGSSPVVFGASPGGGRPFGGPPGGRNGQSLSAEQKETRRRERLDQTTPEFRALRDQYFRDMQARRQQRGLTTFSGPR